MKSAISERLLASILVGGAAELEAMGTDEPPVERSSVGMSHRKLGAPVTADQEKVPEDLLPQMALPPGVDAAAMVEALTNTDEVKRDQAKKSETGSKLRNDVLSFFITGPCSMPFLGRVANIQRIVAITGGGYNDMRKDMSGGIWTESFIMVNFYIPIEIPEEGLGKHSRKKLLERICKKYPAASAILMEVEKDMRGDENDSAKAN